ncbi:EAL domain-containing protein [Niveibacterium terrae]|uniref:EAL domain-containing protein n=1 Tax=Niveibacterium terrae TaxID=3373598 RepID=UPI003A92C923
MSHAPLFLSCCAAVLWSSRAHAAYLPGDLPGAACALLAVLAVLAAVLMFRRLGHWRRISRLRERELREAREDSSRFRQMIEGTNAVAWEFDAASGQCTYVSPQAEQLLGFPASAWFQPGFWSENLHPEDRSFTLEFFRAQIALGYDHELEYRMQHADGNTVFVRDMRTLHRGAGGRIERVRSLLVNLTVHKATEAALEDSEARFRSTFEQAAVGMAMCSLSGRYTRVNRRYSEICGHSEAELLQSDFRIITDPRDREHTEQMFSHLLETPDRTASLDKRLQRPDGSRVWVHVTASVMRSMRREATQFIEVLEDITLRREAERVLRKSEGQLRTVLSALDEGIVLRDTTGRVLLCNASAAQIYGLSEEDLSLSLLQDKNIHHIWANGRPRELASLPCQKALNNSSPSRDNVCIRQADGSIRWLSMNCEPLLREEDGEVYAVLSTISDITERRRSEDELRLAATVFDNSVEAILIFDADKRILRVNPAFTKATGFRAEEVIGRSGEFLASSRHDEEFQNTVWAAVAECGFWQGEMWNTRKNGSVFPEWLSISAVHDERGATTSFVAEFSDITERKASEARIAYLAHHDPLTALPNRTLLQDRLLQAVARANREQSMVGLLFLDLDRFKTINDSLGHHAGDKLLKKVAERLGSCVRESDTICRQGGDEFIIVLPDLADADAAGRVAEKILNHFTEAFGIDSHSIATTFSIGIAVYPGDGEDPDSLMKNADTAMYHAKESGRSTYRFFTETMNADALERLQLENGLRQALEREEFQLHYQPQVSLSDGRIIGAEALIRWNRPEHGMVPPDRFISIAEESGLIVPIGRWVMREACRQTREWQDAGLPPITMAVNLSALQFRRDDILATVKSVLEESALAPEHLELELTESLLMENAEDVMSKLKQLKAMGVRLSIDDFGTGYSSLAYLKRLEVDRLKIDQSFVRDVPHDSEDAAIVRAVVQLGRSLRLEVIAEGVETLAHVGFLSAENCLIAQGYYYCRPVPAETFGEILSKEFLRPRAIHAA